MWLQCLFRTGCTNCVFVSGSISGMSSSSMSIESLPCVFCDDSALSTSTMRCVFFTKSVYRFDVCALNFGCVSLRWSSNTWAIKWGREREKRRREQFEWAGRFRLLVLCRIIPDRMLRQSSVWPPLSQCHYQAWNHVPAYIPTLPNRCTCPCLHHL